MNIDIRKSIKDNFKGADTSEIKASIESSITDGEEITLPGLGVFFEVMWKNSDFELQNVLLENIKKGLNWPFIVVQIFFQRQICFSYLLRILFLL